MTTTAPTLKELVDLGFTAAANELNLEQRLAAKLRIAFEHFRVVDPEHIERFNADLKQKTMDSSGYERDKAWGAITFDRLKFTPIADYPSVPPAEVLLEVGKAKALGCFDAFEVATIESVKVVPDPIIFGRIIGSEKRYFIAQWDEDVKIEDILREDEG